MEKRDTPFACQVFVCVNDRQGERKSCADDNGREIKDMLKAQLKKRAFAAGKVRVSQSGCLGICECGPNVMLHPQRILFTNVTLDDVDAIVEEVERIMTDDR